MKIDNMSPDGFPPSYAVEDQKGRRWRLIPPSGSRTTPGWYVFPPKGAAASAPYGGTMAAYAANWGLVEDPMELFGVNPEELLEKWREVYPA